MSQKFTDRIYAGMIDEEAVTLWGPGITAPPHQTQELPDIQRKLSLKLRHTGILESIPSIKSYSTVVQMWEENVTHAQCT